MSKLYPLKFEPILKDKIWGGQKLSSLLGKDGSQLPNIGESWELSGVENDVSVVANGFLEGNSLNELIEVYMGDLVGDKIYNRFGNQFPLLIKFIDATADLSIQVHPNDEVAMERHDTYGKTEMWYVMQADKGSSLISGFKTDVSVESYLKHVDKKSLAEILGSYTVQSGDVFFIPAGRVHAIGAGIMLAEIQQTSDTTYRIYDYDRKDDQGNLRQLHTDMALDIIEYKKPEEIKVKYLPQANTSTKLVQCEFFTTNIIELVNVVVKDYFKIDSFVIYICIEGSFKIYTSADHVISVAMGETVLIPAECNEVKLIPAEKAKLLEVYI